VRPFGPLRVFQGGREGGALMTEATVRESVKVAGLAERTRIVRSFVGAVLGPGHPCGDDAVLLVSELFANSLQHSGSGVPGETVTVTVTSRAGAVRVEVADRCGPGVPQLRLADRDAEDGRGLGLVARLAARWGWRRRGGQMVTWFEIQALLQPVQHSVVSGKRLNPPVADVRGS
jgi:anti-sigma regulatory factor (Ser/Thr protein kinase)